MPSGQNTHTAAENWAVECKAGQMDRREFLTRATALGVSAGAAYAMLGLNGPAHAQAAAKQGGTLRIAMPVRELRVPRMYDTVEMGNLTTGVFETLVEYQADGSFRPMLAESWTVNENATEYTIKLRPGVKWGNGDDLTAQQVAATIEGWCDKTVEGNGMPNRVGSLIDEETGKAADGAITVVDAQTIVLRPLISDITLIPSMAEYAAPIAHPDFDPSDISTAIGTGPFRLVEHEVGGRLVIERNADVAWWGAEVYGGPYLDRFEIIDYGTEMISSISAVESDEVDMLWQSTGEFIQILDDIGWTKSETVTGQTVVFRPQQVAEVNGSQPYADARVRRALAMAIDNAVILELGYSGLGSVAENHHVAPIHPEYAELEPVVHDPAAAMALMEEAGMADFEHELVSIDSGWMRDTADAVGAQLRDAGMNVSRKVVPSAAYWNDWNKFPFSSTDWNHRPLGIQVLNIAYRGGASWNEAGFSNAEFDSLLDQGLAISDADKRREVSRRLQEIMREEGVVVQPYWRSLFRHHKPEVVGAEMHPAAQIFPYRFGFAG